LREPRSETSLEGLREAAGANADARDLDLVLAARAALSSGLSKLPAKQRLALALRYVHDLSDEEIAAALGWWPGWVHALLSRGRAALRNDQTLVRFSQAVSGG
jgi:DNA-directed RNA polymerase specialized sigma24 family protein